MKASFSQGYQEVGNEVMLNLSCDKLEMSPVFSAFLFLWNYKPIKISWKSYFVLKIESLPKYIWMRLLGCDIDNYDLE